MPEELREPCVERYGLATVFMVLQRGMAAPQIRLHTLQDHLAEGTVERRFPVGSGSGSGALQQLHLRARELEAAVAASALPDGLHVSVVKVEGRPGPQCAADRKNAGSPGRTGSS